MESVPAENTEVDENTMQVSQYCLGLPTVLRKILEQFSTKELMQLSLVSKQWNFEARSVLRDRGSLRRKISFKCKYQGLEVLASDFEHMNVVAYSGITIDMTHPPGNGCTSSAKESLDPVCNAILGRLACKHLEVLLGDWFNCQRNCPAFIFVQRILKGYCCVVQELTLDLRWRDELVAELLQDIIQDSHFPRLRTLNINGAYDQDGSIANFIKFLVSCAPNLQELNFEGEMKFETNILEGSSAVLVPTGEFLPLEEHVCESLVGALRAKRIDILKDKNMELLNGYIPMVLEASCTSLKILDLELFFLLPLMCYGICLENVTDLRIRLSSDSLRDVQPEVLELLGKFDFTRVLPKLTTVKVDGWSRLLSPDGISGFVERGHAVLRNALPDRAINIEHLELLRFDDSEYIGPLYSQMFPNVKRLYVKDDRSDPYPFALIWEHFSNLEELDVEISEWTSRARAKVGDFCGIFPEEVAELMEKDEEYLKAVNIVPVMPSIRNMRNLRILKLALFTNDCRSEYTLWFKKVAGLLGFGRCPALAVTLAMW